MTAAYMEVPDRNGTYRFTAYHGEIVCTFYPRGLGGSGDPQRVNLRELPHKLKNIASAIRPHPTTHSFSGAGHLMPNKFFTHKLLPLRHY